MANILGVFTAVILAAAAFVALKNNARLEVETTNRLSEEQKLADNQKKLNDALAVVKALPAERAKIDLELVAKIKEETALKDSKEALKADIENKTGQIKVNKKELEELNEKAGKIGNIRELATKVQDMRTDLEALTQSIATQEATLSKLSAKTATTDANVRRQTMQLDALSRSESLPSLKTSIRSIYPTWGFVTLNAGNNAGVIMSSTLDVVRNGATIAKLLVTSVESRSASASIIPDSITSDITLKVGDRVVSGSKIQATAQN